ncbi:siphovirus ReqiPepy6 Gp37-like family protein [Streptomyces ardesiacus]|uniref:siphovirus ReqiPepy6 Gp37-like family protein n=1 Tax=Streptomyces ardesiacus TaxID=285564 RepID=UPI003648BE05
MAYRIEVRDRDLNRIGEIDTWLQLDMVVQFNDQGSWNLLIKAGTPQAELLQQGGGVAIYQDGVQTPILTGQIETFQKYWTTVQHSSEGSIFVGGKTDNKLAYQRLAFPEPGLPVSEQYSSPNDTRAAKAQVNVLMWDELNKALGPGAISNRRVAGVTTGTAPTGFGAVKADTLRYDVIGEKLSEWGSDNKTGWRFIYNPNTRSIDLRVYQPRDLSKKIRFSPELGNLREFIWTLTAPKVTRVIVACQGEGKERYIWQKIDSVSEAEWNLQIEQFVDRRDIPLKTDSNGNPVLVTKLDSEGFEDLGDAPDGVEWTSDLDRARRNYQTAKQERDAAQAQLDAAETQAEKDAANARLSNATTALNIAKAELRDQISAAKATVVDYYLEVIEQAADEVLKEGEKSGNFQIYPIDTEQVVFGRDYFVGDIVTVEVDGTSYSDIVREVSISVDDGGNAVSVSPKIGEQGSGEPLNLYQSVYDMRKKLRKLEARM